MTYIRADAIWGAWIDATWEGQPYSFCVDPAGFLALPPTATVTNRETISDRRPDPDVPADNPALVLRLYCVIDVSAMAATPTEEQWQALIARTKRKPLASAIISFAKASQNYLSASFRSLDAKRTLAWFEIDAADKSAALTTLNTQATADSVSGSVTAKFVGVLQYELRAAAVDLGYTQTQANKLVVTVVNDPGVFDRASAIEKVIAYLAANAAVWGSAGGTMTGAAGKA
jgi:hypothetical protein